MLWGENFTILVTCVDKMNLQTSRNIQGSGRNSTTIQHKVKYHNLFKIINSDN
ncbi:unnamed protein product [Meloidogyne enterolobii]|uniref:Uncharacterized protein n=1 Tax=Meloidogyne enterolobii TaxID=390850 RepID=A0ACB0XKA8_MELEN